MKNEDLEPNDLELENLIERDKILSEELGIESNFKKSVVDKKEAEIWASTAIQTMDTTFCVSNFLQREDESKPLSKDEMKTLVTGLRSKFTELGGTLASTPKTIEAMFEYDMSDEFISKDSFETIKDIYEDKMKSIKALEDPKLGSFTKRIDK